MRAFRRHEALPPPHQHFNSTPQRRAHVHAQARSLVDGDQHGAAIARHGADGPHHHGRGARVQAWRGRGREKSCERQEEPRAVDVTQ